MKFNFQILLLGTLTLLCGWSLAWGQSEAPFQGRGLKDRGLPTPNFFGWSGSSDSSTESASGMGWFGQGILRSARPGEVEDRPRLLGGLFQRDESSPSLIQRANERSQEFMNRTRDWAAEKNEAFKNRVSEAWGSLTAGLRPGTAQEKDPQPVERPGTSQPMPFSGIRTAEKPDSTKTDRF